MCCFSQPFKVYPVKVSHVVFTNSLKYLVALNQKLLFYVLFLSALQSLPCCFHQQHKVSESSYPKAVSLSPSKPPTLFSPTAQSIQQLWPKSCFFQPFKISHVVFTNSTKYPEALTKKLLFHVLFFSALQSLPCCFHQQHKVSSSFYPEAVPCATSLSPSKPPMLFSEVAQSI